MDFLRDPIWQFVGVLIAVILAVAPLAYRFVRRRLVKKSVSVKSQFPKILVIHSRPDYLYKALGKDPKNVQKVKNPTAIREHKPEVITDIEPDSSIIQHVFDETGKRMVFKALSNSTKSDLAMALRSEWDIVHFDCVVGPNGQLFLDDGDISPQSLQELLSDKKVKLLVLMDCDSLRVVSSATSAGVKALIAVTGSLPVLAAEKFCFGLYKSIAAEKSLMDSFADGKALASIELGNSWESSLFVLDGDSSLKF